MFAVLSGTVFGFHVLSCGIGLVAFGTLAGCVAFLFVAFLPDTSSLCSVPPEEDWLELHSQSPAKQISSVADIPPAHIRHVEERGRFVCRFEALE